VNLPRFRLDRELGTGSSGRVWHGVLLEPFEGLPQGAELAVKYLHPRLEQDPSALAAFEQEAQAGLAVRHEHVVRMLAQGRDAKGRFLVMRYCPGRTLREVFLEAGGLPEPQTRAIGAQISSGLAALHAAGYRHGDIKPENIRIDSEGRAVLLDLGFAERLGSRERTTTSARGSLPYLSPEQARGERGGKAADLFALGVVLYELSTGVHPFAREARELGGALPGFEAASGSSGAVTRAALERPQADQLLAAIATARFVPPSRIVPLLSPFLDAHLAGLLARDPERRPAAAQAQRQLEEGEAGEWWRAQLQFEAGQRRGGSGESDARHLLPLVGRERELELVQSAFECGVHRRVRAELAVSPESVPPESATAQGGACLILQGPAGTGKSRLINEFVSRARTSSDPPLYLYGRCRELDEERPCHPILRLLERYLRLPDGVAPRERERSELARMVPPRIVETLMRALDPHGEGSGGLSVPVALAIWLVALGREMPLVVFLDDAHWAREDTLETLELAAEKLGGTRTLLVVAARSENLWRAPLAQKRLEARLLALLPVFRLELENLDNAAVQDLVRALFHHTVAQLHLARTLHERSRGNPAHIAELLRGLHARGEIRRHADGTGLELVIAPDRLPLPPSLNRAIQESYKRLSVNERSWLRRLAVVGGRIEADFLAQAFAPGERAEVDMVLARLVREGWLVPVGARYRFARPALREAVYRLLTREQRQRLHALAAEALKPAPERVPSMEDAFQRAFHLRAAQRHEELLAMLPGLLSRLLKSGEPQRVHALSRWGLEALEALPRERVLDRRYIELLEAAVDAADRLGFREGQREFLDRLSDLAFDPDDDPEAVGRVYLLHGRYAVSTGQFGLARGMLRNAVQLFEKSATTILLSEALRRLAHVQAQVGELTDARQLAERALALAEVDAQRALARNALGVIDVLEDQLESALSHADSALALLRSDRGYHIPGAHAAAYLLRARVYRILGSPARALASASRAARLAAISGEKRLLAEISARLGGLLLDLNRPREAEARIREALRLSDAIEDRRGQAIAGLFLGILLWEQTDPEALQTLNSAGELARTIGLERLEAVALALMARVHREAGRLEEALELCERASQSLEQHGAELNDRIVIRGTHALVLATRGARARSRRIERELEQRIESDNRRIRSPRLLLRHDRAARRLLEAVLSPEGPVYPRAAT
jgi:serine/threonine protein kinase/tetratricopeptide (TPR) repeat protein